MNETCAICLEKIQDDQNVKILPCQHRFHHNCINRWKAQKMRDNNKNEYSCPVCRLTITIIGIEPIIIFTGYRSTKVGLRTILYPTFF